MLWAPVSKEGQIEFRVDGNKIAFDNDNVRSYPQLIVWALEMRRMMGVRVPEGTIGRLNEAWDALQTLGVFEEAATSWKEHPQKELQTTNRIAEGWTPGRHIRERSSVRGACF